MTFFKQIKIKETNKEKKDNSPLAIPKEKGWLKSEGQLAVDVYETGSDFVVISAIAGVPAENIDISIEKDMLIIKGHRQSFQEQKDKNYFYQECYWGSFSRKIILPEHIDVSRTDATMDKGILIVKIPKVQPVKKSKITVKE